jgi:anti-sigma factor RsiW
MARCDDIKLLLGPFEDGELEPHEMQEVARHVVSCDDCEGELADYRAMAVSLRGAAATPDLAGFSTAVLARIEELPRPFGVRIRRYLTSFSDGLGATIATGFAAAAVAVVTAVVLTPYFKQAPFWAGSRAPAEIARGESSVPLKSAASSQSVASQQSAAPQAVASADRSQSTLPNDIANGLATGDTGSDLAPVAASSDTAGNSGAIISRLEADSPSVAVWSEPQSDTTVIWVPDQPR